MVDAVAVVVEGLAVVAMVDSVVVYARGRVVVVIVGV